MKLFAFILILLISGFSFSQDPFYYSESSTPIWSNPASFGSWNRFSANITGQSYLDNHGSPSNLMINSELSLNVGNHLNWARPVVINVGMNGVFQSEFYRKSQYFNVPIAVPVRIRHTQLAFGVSPGFKRLNYSIFENPTTFPQPPLPEPGTAFDLSSGVFWSGAKFYVGYSANHLVKSKQTNLIGPIQHNLQAGYRFKIGKHYLFPTVSYSYQDGFSRLVSMNYFQFKEDLFSIAVGYNARNSIILGASGRMRNFKLSYFYEVLRSPLTNAYNGNHEMRLSYVIGK